MCVCVCARARARLYVCVRFECVCVCVRARARARSIWPIYFFMCVCTCENLFVYERKVLGGGYFIQANKADHTQTVERIIPCRNPCQ